MPRFLFSVFQLIIFLWFLQPELQGSDNKNTNRLFAYDVKCYSFDLELDNLSEYIEGSVTVLVEMLEPGHDTILLELSDSAGVDSVYINNQAVGYRHANDFLYIGLPHASTPGSLLSIAVFYNIAKVRPMNNRGISTQITSLGKSVTWTLSEPFYSKNWFPCKQVLDDKADSVILFLTVADSLLVGSNGLLVSVTELPGSKRRFEWRSYYPMAYYLISFAVADYMDYSFYVRFNDTDSLLVQNFIYNDSSFFNSNKELIDATGPLLQVFHDCFGPYPFLSEKYGHCLAPLGGGMEHQTMTTLGNFGFVLVAHELAHQWFGNNVTCQNWQDIWINEGFASYSEYIAIERLKPEEQLQAWLSDALEFIISSPNGSVYLPAKDSANVSRIFDYRLSYRKGAYLIHMIRHELGNDSLFFSVLKSFQKQYSGRVATAHDFIALLQTETQKNFTTFFDQWYFGEGYPILDVNWKQQNDTLYIDIRQEVSAPVFTPFFELLIDFKISFPGGDTLVQFRQTKPNEQFQLVMNKWVHQLTPDPKRNIITRIRSVNREREPDSTSLFLVFPNPSTHEIFIVNYDAGLPFLMKLYSPNGILIDEVAGSNAYIQYNISSFAPGIYQLVVSRDRYQEVFKIAKL